MMAFSRVAYVCKCPTRLPDGPRARPDVRGPFEVRLGGPDDLRRLPADYAGPSRLPELRARLDAGELFLVGELDGLIASCTWLRQGGSFSLHHLPRATFRLAPNVGYGHDAWTDPALSGKGLRRAVFEEELRTLDGLGFAWEVSYFVDHQLEGGRRTLARIGAPLTVLWKVVIQRDGGVALTELTRDGAALPSFDHTLEEAR
jgi:hypothetical protein